MLTRLIATVAALLIACASPQAHAHLRVDRVSVSYVDLATAALENASPGQSTRTPKTAPPARATPQNPTPGKNAALSHWPACKNWSPAPKCMSSFGVTGYLKDPLLDELYAQARQYNPRLGRFTSVDPWQGDVNNPLSLNKYLAFNGNPGFYIDPDGRMGSPNFLEELPGHKPPPGNELQHLDGSPQALNAAMSSMPEAQRQQFENAQALGALAATSLVPGTMLARGMYAVGRLTYSAYRGGGAYHAANVAVLEGTALAESAAITSMSIATGAEVPSVMSAPATAARSLTQTARALDTGLDATRPMLRVADDVPVPPSLVSSAGQPGQARVVVEAGDGGTAVVANTSGATHGLTPSNFGLSTIADNPQLHRMWNDATRSAASSSRSNGYTRYLDALDRGDTVSQQMLEEAFDAVNKRFLTSARQAGNDFAQVHHWNFGKSDFPTQIVDPRHLVPVPSRGVHEEIHRLTSGSTDIWSGPIAPQHRIIIPEWSTPLAW